MAGKLFGLCVCLFVCVGKGEGLIYKRLTIISDEIHLSYLYIYLDFVQYFGLRVHVR